ncbi:class II aldolase/adducin family protein [Phenylobacterium sp.]|uniref:class II aldolase/adducin family protein n=1 Tax=Phenylobacterium sp. TaxID=1871053 RepID=UPI0035B07EE9
MSQPNEAELRAAMTRVMKAMDERGLNRGTSGNVSVRFGQDMLVTPSGVPAPRLEPEHMVLVRPDGSSPEGAMRPSSEWRMHWGLLASRTDVNAVVHCHSRYATILACAGRPIPAVHYMVAVSGGSSIPVAPYATFGTPELAEAVAASLDGRYAALMANHGQIVVAPSLDRALSIAEEVEEQAAVYWGTLAIGGPNLLDDQAMAAISGQFAAYGQRPRKPAP